MKKLIFASLIAVLWLCLCPKITIAQENNTVYNFISMESPPIYPDGMQKFYDFINENLKYPKEAVEEKVQGTVLMSFVVDKDGSLSDIKIDRKLGSGIDDEALRIVKLSKRWNPGMINGKPVKVKFNIPIKFTLPGKSAMNGIVKDSPSVPKTVEPNDDTIYSFISLANPATYPGGMPAFYNFINHTLKYPEEAKKEKIQGSVLTSFVVEKNGSITDIKIDHSLGGGTDEETIRVLKLSRRWNPGTINGVPVRVKYNIPVKFTLPNP